LRYKDTIFIIRKNSTFFLIIHCRIRNNPLCSSLIHQIKNIVSILLCPLRGCGGRLARHHELCLNVNNNSYQLIKKRRMGESGVSNGIAMLAQDIILIIVVQSVILHLPGRALQWLPV